MNYLTTWMAAASAVFAAALVAITGDATFVVVLVACIAIAVLALP